MTDWSIGCQVLRRGVGEGEQYEDKGRILEGENGRTNLSLSQDNNSSAKKAQHSKAWAGVKAIAKRD